MSRMFPENSPRARVLRSRARQLLTALAVLAVLVTAGLSRGASPASAAGDLIRDFEVTASSPEAGSHSDVRVAFKLDTVERSLTGYPDPFLYPREAMRDVSVDLPPGLLADPTSTPTCRDEDISGASFEPCDPESQVGVIRYRRQEGYAYDGFNGILLQTYPIFNMERNPGEPARLAFNVGNLTVIQMNVRTREESDQGVSVELSRLPSTFSILDADVELWGAPGDPSHDEVRGACLDTFGAGPTGERCPSARPVRPFMVSSTRCDAAETARLRVTTFQGGDTVNEARSNPVQVAGCDGLPFAPSLAASPASAVAGQPSGYRVDLNVPQTTEPTERATAHVRDVAVTMPDGVAISPSAANGLGACTDEQGAFGTRNAPTCPDSAKIGTTRIDSPVVDAPLEGSVFLGNQLSGDPESGQMYRLFLVAEGSGVRVKLKGSIRADRTTGQLTASFANNPQLPFDALSLTFDGGPRAPLVNPPTCGRKTTKATITSWAGQSVSSESSFDITEGCPTGQFSPSFRAGTVSPLAGAFSPFTTTIGRSDADQEFKQIGLDLPSGLLGALGKVPVCAEAQAAAGTCGVESRLGSTTVLAGSGSQPFSLPGTVSLGGPYKGAPFSLSIAVPAKAGPLDLGMVVVRSPLIVDANNAKVSAPADPLPTIVGGVPLKLRQVTITLDRPGFMWNATNCTPTVVGVTIVGTGGAIARPTNRYQADGCANLKLAPSLKIAYTGKANLKKGKNTGLTADLGQTFGQTGLKQVKVTLPTISSLQPKNAEALCTPAQAAARACPDGSIVGRASALTPALHERLSGPVYFLEGTRKTASGKVVPTLPKLWLKLRGDGVDLDLRADTAVSGKRLVTTFTSIPDAPIANFKLEIFGGKNGILAAVEDPCTASRRTDVTFDGQNGKRLTRALNISAAECGVRASMNATASRVRFGFTGIAAGKVSVSGKGLVKSSRTVKRGDRTTLTAKLTAATRRRIASGHTVKLRLTASFDPKGKGKTTKITKTVTIKGAKKGR
jgi:hypothetical protein